MCDASVFHSLPLELQVAGGVLSIVLSAWLTVTYLKEQHPLFIPPTDGPPELYMDESPSVEDHDGGDDDGE